MREIDWIWCVGGCIDRVCWGGVLGYIEGCVEISYLVKKAVCVNEDVWNVNEGVLNDALCCVELHGSTW